MPRPLPLLSAVALLVLLACAPLRSPATTVIAPEFDSLVQQSGFIVRATVRSVTPYWKDTPGEPGARHIESKIELEVLEAIKGQPPARLMLRAAGGRIGDDELVVVGTPKFTVGEEGVFFVHAEQKYFSPLVALQHGHYLIQRDAQTKRERVVRASGRPLYHEREVSLPLGAPSPEALRNPQAQPLTPAQFAARIRAVANVPARESQR